MSETETKEITVTLGGMVKIVEQNSYCLSITQYSGSFFKLG